MSNRKWDIEKASFFADTIQVNTSADGSQSVTLRDLVLNDIDINECYLKVKKELSKANDENALNETTK